MKRILLAAIFILAGSAASAQQTFSEVQRAALAQQQAANAPVRINVSINIFVPAPSGMGDQALAEHEKARRHIYQLAMKECAVLVETIATDCKMETMNVNVHRHQGQQPVEGFQVGANMNFRITLR